jgi:hypothetical protein
MRFLEKREVDKVKKTEKYREDKEKGYFEN